MSPDTVATIRDQLDKKAVYYNRMWSWYRFLYFAVAAIGLVGGGGAALLAKFQSDSADEASKKRRQNLIAIFGVAAAVVAGINVGTDLNTSAFANRAAKLSIFDLKADVSDGKFHSQGEVERKMNEIERKKEETIQPK